MISKTCMILAAAAAIAVPRLASAAEVVPACTAPAVLPTELAGWATPVARSAASNVSALPNAALVIGQAASVTLAPTPSVAYPLRPEKPGGSVSFGGMLQVVVTTRGTYRVALGSPAWIDLVTAGGAVVVSTAHRHGPTCTGVRKMVDFVLEPGTYTLQISANSSPDSNVLVVLLP